VATAWADAPPGLQPSLAQLGEDTVSQYTNPDTNITFNRWAIEEIVEEEGYGQGFYDFGMILPPDALEKDANEYIGYLVGILRPGDTASRF